AVKESSMPLVSHRPSTFRLACVFILATTALAGDQASGPDGLAAPETFTADQRSHWAYQPVKRVEPPAVKEASWVRNPIDRFILADLEKLELPHAPAADRRVLIRRLSFDLTGLPPQPDEVAAFEDDTRPDAYERLVERL